MNINNFFANIFADQNSTLFICLFYIHEEHMLLHVHLEERKEEKVSNDLFVSINILCFSKMKFPSHK